MDWLRYHHILRPRREGTGGPEPELITDFIGYNTANVGGSEPPQNWVGDLILDCDVTVEQPEGQLVLELSKGIDRFRARWDLSSGVCTLLRVTEDGEQQLGESKTSLANKGTYQVRFANVDERLVVWVNKELPFGEGVKYDPPRKRGPLKSDLEPASIGVKGAAVAVHKLTLWRDTYYTLDAGKADGAPGSRPEELHQFLSDPDQWKPLRELEAKTLYVQPHHYLCMGDNSPASSDGRTWGLVPERLMLGRALFVYYPFRFPYWPLYDPVNRVGPIR
jgi:signal peptidase I